MSEVEARERRIVAVEAAVRDAAALRDAVADGVARLGTLDIVVANAGIGLMSEEVDDEQAFRDQIEVNLFGVWNTVQAAAPVMIAQGRGGAIMLTGSTLGLVGRGGVNEAVAKLFASSATPGDAHVGNLLDVQLIEAVDLTSSPRMNPGDS